jgi:hypothetical protein
MSTDYRALCAELANHLQGRKDLECGWPGEDPEQDLLDRARTALAQPEPEGVTDIQIMELMPQQLQKDFATVSRLAAHGAGPDVGPGLFRVSLNTGIIEHCRAVLAHYARPTIEPVPVAEDVSHEEILRLAAKEIGYEFTGQWFLTGGKGLTLETNPLELLNFAHAILARWGHPTTEPVLVAERLPGAEDCDESGRCWWLALAIAEGGRGGYSTYWELTTFRAAVRCASHWLPHYALPVPGAEAG